jgi:hypothetical protein
LLTINPSTFNSGGELIVNKREIKGVIIKGVRALFQILLLAKRALTPLIV